MNDADVNHLGDFNIWVDDIIGITMLNFFFRLQFNFCLVILVNKVTYNFGHTLVLVITKNHHSLVKSSTVDTINTLSDHRNLNFHLNSKYSKVEKKTYQVQKNKSSFPGYLREELEDDFSITQNDYHNTDFNPCVNCVTTKFKRLSRDVYEKWCPSIEKNILIKGE